jgi:hypothetical protein
MERGTLGHTTRELLAGFLSKRYPARESVFDPLTRLNATE